MNDLLRLIELSTKFQNIRTRITGSVRGWREPGMVPKYSPEG